MLPIVPSQRRQGSGARRRRPRILPAQSAAAGRTRRQKATPAPVPPGAADGDPAGDAGPPPDGTPAGDPAASPASAAPAPGNRPSMTNVKTTAPAHSGGAGRNRPRRRIIAGPGDGVSGSGGRGVTFSDPPDDAGGRGGDAGDGDGGTPGGDGATPESDAGSGRAGSATDVEGPPGGRRARPSDGDENDPPPPPAPSPSRPASKRPRPDGGVDTVLTFETRVPRTTEMSNAQRSFLGYYYETAVSGMVERHDRDAGGDGRDGDGEGDGKGAEGGGKGGDGKRAEDVPDRPLSAFCTGYARRKPGRRGKKAAGDPSAPKKEWEDDGGEAPAGPSGSGDAPGRAVPAASPPPAPPGGAPAAGTRGEEGRDDPLSVGPRVEFGPDGRIVIAPSSLLPGPSNRLTTDDIDAQLDPVVVDEGSAPSALGAVGAGPSSFATRTAARRWTARETRAFYDALRRCGADFSTMELYFGGTRDRGQLKRKYKTEQRRNGRLVDMALDPRRGLRLDLDGIAGASVGAVTGAVAVPAGGKVGMEAAPVPDGRGDGSVPAKSVEEDGDGADAGPVKTAEEDRYGHLFEDGGGEAPDLPRAGDGDGPPPAAEAGTGSPAAEPRKSPAEDAGAAAAGTAALVPLAPGGGGTRAKPRRARFKVKPKGRRAGARK